MAENNVFDNVQLALVTDLDSDLPGNICNVGNVLSGGSTLRITSECNLKVCQHLIPRPWTECRGGAIQVFLLMRLK